MTTRWPRELAPRGVTVAANAPITSGGQPVGAASPTVVASDAGAWAIEYQDIPVWGARLRQARGLAAELAMGANEVLVSPVDYVNKPAGMTSSVALAVAALRATTIVVRSEGATWQAGQYFGLGGERLHLVATVAAYGGDPRDQTLTFWPPLRAAVSISDALEFADPLVKCLVVEPARLAARIATIGGVGSVSVSFQESF